MRKVKDKMSFKVKQSVTGSMSPPPVGSRTRRKTNVSLQCTISEIVSPVQRAFDNSELDVRDMDVSSLGVNKSQSTPVQQDINKSQSTPVDQTESDQCHGMPQLTPIQGQVSLAMSLNDVMLLNLPHELELAPVACVLQLERGKPLIAASPTVGTKSLRCADMGPSLPHSAEINSVGNCSFVTSNENDGVAANAASVAGSGDSDCAPRFVIPKMPSTPRPSPRKRRVAYAPLHQLANLGSSKKRKVADTPLSKLAGDPTPAPNADIVDNMTGSQANCDITDTRSNSEPSCQASCEMGDGGMGGHSSDVTVGSAGMKTEDVE